MKETLCWKCAVPGTGGCSWDAAFEPVDGWIATPTLIVRGYRETGAESFVVKSCPLFRPEKSVEERMNTYGNHRKITDEQLQACLDVGMNDVQIAALFGMSCGTVYRRKAKLEKKKRETRGNA